MDYNKNRLIPLRDINKMNDNEILVGVAIAILCVMLATFAAYLGLSFLALVQVIVAFGLWCVVMFLAIKTEMFKQYMPWIIGGLFLVTIPAIKYWSINPIYSLRGDTVYEWWSAGYILSAVYLAIVGLLFLINKKLNRY